MHSLETLDRTRHRSKVEITRKNYCRCIIASCYHCAIIANGHTVSDQKIHPHSSCRNVPDLVVYELNLKRDEGCVLSSKNCFSLIMRPLGKNSALNLAALRRLPPLGPIDVFRSVTRSTSSS